MPPHLAAYLASVRGSMPSQRAMVRAATGRPNRRIRSSVVIVCIGSLRWGRERHVAALAEQALAPVDVEIEMYARGAVRTWGQIGKPAVHSLGSAAAWIGSVVQPDHLLMARQISSEMSLMVAISRLGIWHLPVLAAVEAMVQRLLADAGAGPISVRIGATRPERR